MSVSEPTKANGKAARVAPPATVTRDDITEERPFEATGGWKWKQRPQTRPFRPNRLYADEKRGVVVLVCAKSKTGDDYAVSADALVFLAARVADPQSWVKAAYVMLVNGDFEKPNEITIAGVMSNEEAVAKVSGMTPLNGRGEFGPYYWLRRVEIDDTPM